MQELIAIALNGKDREKSEWNALVVREVFTLPIPESASAQVKVIVDFGDLQYGDCLKVLDKNLRR